MSQTFDRKALQDNYEDALFRLVMADYANAQGKTLTRENEELKKDQADSPTTLEMKKFQRVLNKAFRKRAVKSVLTKSYKIVVSKVAAIIAVFFFGFFLTAMSVQAVRVSVLNFLIGFEKEYTSLQISDAGGNSIIGNNVFVSWTDAYVPTYIPVGFKTTRLNNEPDLKTINYLHEDGRTIFYYEMSAMYESNLDTENAERIESININGHDALFVEKGRKLSVAWENDSRMFVISAEVSEDELIKIAEGVIFIVS